METILEPSGGNPPEGFFVLKALKLESRAKDTKKEALLFSVNSTTGEKTELQTREGKPILNPKAPNSIRVRAWAIANTPIPDFIDTDFYLGLVPDGVITRRKGKTKFRG